MEKVDATLAELGKRWGKLLFACADPFTVVLAASAGALYFLSSTGLSGVAHSVVQLLLSVASGIVGARIAAISIGLKGEADLEGRGKTAVRSLKAMLLQASALEARVRTFISRHSETTLEAVRNYEEVVAACGRLQEQALISIENWTDIVPEASVGQDIGVITGLQAEIDGREQRIQEAEARIAEISDKNETERRTWQRVADTMAKERAKLMGELAQANLKLIASPRASTPFGVYKSAFAQLLDEKVGHSAAASAELDALANDPIPRPRHPDGDTPP